MTEPETEPNIKALLKALGQDFFLKSDIYFIRQLFYQSEYKPTGKRQFETSEVMRI
jgi:hypothetical protein